MFKKIVMSLVFTLTVGFCLDSDDGVIWSGNLI